MTSAGSASRVVVVTGATSGIGRALALEFHGRGHVVYATGRNQTQLDQLADAGLRTAVLDVTNAEDVERFVDRLAADGVSVRTLVNNAGYGLMGPLVDLPHEELEHQFHVNVFAPLRLTKALLGQLIDDGDGRIINISSVSGVLATPFAGAYCASKFAFNGLSDSLRMELAPLGVKVITVQPGGIRSNFGATAEAGADRDYSGSRYASASAAIAARAGASQHKATPAEDFAREAVDAVLAQSPKPVITLGHGARALVLLGRFVPAQLRDKLLSRRFQLDQLRATS